MEKYLVLCTVTSQSVANRVCSSLEENGIPVLIEHVTIQEESDEATGFRVLVPSDYAQTAMMLVGKRENPVHKDRSAITDQVRSR